MAGLKATTARLAAYRRQWEQFRPANPAGGAGSSAHLTEIAGFGANPGQLRMLAYVPEALRPGAPLVVVLHGCKQDAAGYGGNSGWTTLAERLGFAVLLPEQRATNNPNLCFNWFLPEDTRRGGGEAASIHGMIQRMTADHDLDRGRVFVTGLSAGGAMTAVMLAAYPETFAGGAILAGLPYGVACNVQEALDAMFQGGERPAEEWGDKVRSASRHKGPWPRLSIWHGSADATVRLSNAGEIEKQWSNVHNVPLSAAETQRVDGHTRRVWLNGAGEPVMESYLVAGMAHGTPIAAALGADGGGTAAPFILEAGIASTLRIAEFWGLAQPATEAAPRPIRSAAQAHGPEAAYVPRPAATGAGRLAAGAPPSGKLKGKAAAGALSPDPQSVIDRALKAAGLLKR
jgi:poly(hydroxyalkanoate) depolymerase family esterase